MSRTNERKDATLGMSHGTASNRLRKNILFNLLCKLNENVCFKCTQKINNVDELSIEHKLPWEGISAELFWDLNNIAFSHVRCNRPHRLHGPKIFVPEGMAWCSGHQMALPISEFHRRINRNKSSDLQPYCKSCRSEADIRQNHAKKV